MVSLSALLRMSAKSDALKWLPFYEVKRGIPDIHKTSVYFERCKAARYFKLSSIGRTVKCKGPPSDR